MRTGRPESRWKECRNAISAIAQEAVKYDSDGVEVHFLNSNASKTCKVVTSLYHIKEIKQLTSTCTQTRDEVEDIFDFVKLSRW
jgi:hypothetical protein